VAVNITGVMPVFDYSVWFDRAAKYVETLKKLPGEIKIDGSIRPPISHEEVDDLANRSRLPIPTEMRQLWTKGSSHSNLTYNWTSIPSTLQRQIAIASCDRFSKVVWGGPEFLSAEEIIELSHELPDWAKGMRPDHPKDARIWEHSLPLIPVGNGDYVGLYVDDKRTPCSVVYLCHEASGGSCVIANSLEEFFASWEELSYIGTDFLMTFRSRESDVLATSEHLVRVEMLRSLLRGETRDDLVLPPLVTSEQDWLIAREPDRLLKWLEQKGLREERKTRLYCCACCRRVWNQLGASGQHAVEVSELYADVRASDQELAEARLQLSDGIELSQHLGDGFVDALTAIIEFQRHEGMMQSAAFAAVDANWYISADIVRHFDDPQVAQEKAAHADIVRHIFGNPFRTIAKPINLNDSLRHLAQCVYDGEALSLELSNALKEGGNFELAQHFEVVTHPKGCWALDLLLGH